MKTRFALQIFFLIALPAALVFCVTGLLGAYADDDIPWELWYGLGSFAAISGLTWFWNAEPSHFAEGHKRHR